MKKTLLYLLSLVLLSACCSYNEDLADSHNGLYNVSIRANADVAGSTIDYPVTVYAYNNDGSVVDQKTINTSSDNVSMSLQTGHYTLVAVSGDSDFSNGYTTERPFMIGKKEINLTSDITESITMEYQVASVNVELSDMADDVTDITVSIGSQYGAITNKGELSGSTTASVRCTKDGDGKWKSGTFYVLPSTGSATTITISQTSPTQTKTFVVTQSVALEAGIPYLFKGSYDNVYANHNVIMTVYAGEWGDLQTKDFEFNDKDTGEATPTPPEVEDVLSAPAMWNGHVVVLIEGNKATLFSTKEWKLANVDVLPTSELESYSEDGITGWSLPTIEQAKNIAATYSYANNKIVPLNDLLSSNGLGKVNEGDDVRYLCDDGTSAYSHVNYNNIITTSNKTRDYRIRLVKVVDVK